MASHQFSLLFLAHRSSQSAFLCHGIRAFGSINPSSTTSNVAHPFIPSSGPLLLVPVKFDGHFGRWVVSRRNYSFWRPSEFPKDLESFIKYEEEMEAKRAKRRKWTLPLWYLFCVLYGCSIGYMLIKIFESHFESKQLDKERERKSDIREVVREELERVEERRNRARN